MNKLSRGHIFDAGIDILLDDTVTIDPHSAAVIPLGVQDLDLPVGTAGFLYWRSKFAHLPLLLQNPPIDAGYTGEVHAFVHNFSDKPITLEAGKAYMQLVIVRIATETALSTLGHNTISIKSSENRSYERDTTE